jgi:hypothetical protein
MEVSHVGVDGLIDRRWLGAGLVPPLQQLRLQQQCQPACLLLAGGLQRLAVLAAAALEVGPPDPPTAEDPDDLPDGFVVVFEALIFCHGFISPR